MNHVQNPITKLCAMYDDAPVENKLFKTRQT